MHLPLDNTLNRQVFDICLDLMRLSERFEVPKLYHLRRKKILALELLSTLTPSIEILISQTSIPNPTSENRPNSNQEPEDPAKPPETETPQKLQSTPLTPEFKESNTSNPTLANHQSVPTCSDSSQRNQFTTNQLPASQLHFSSFRRTSGMTTPILKSRRSAIPPSSRSLKTSSPTSDQ